MTEQSCYRCRQRLTLLGSMETNITDQRGKWRRGAIARIGVYLGLLEAGDTVLLDVLECPDCGGVQFTRSAQPGGQSRRRRR